MNHSALERWRETWDLLGLSAPPGLGDRLIRLYQEPHRAYHNLQHVLECLDAASLCRPLQDHPGEVELALWFHDAIYKPQASDNEQQSARLARRKLREARLSTDALSRVEQSILATRHDHPPPHHDAAIVADIDLTILGAPPARFHEFEAAIRREYRWVPDPLFRSGRLHVLNGFQDRDRIYHTDFFFERYEAPARENLRHAIADLQR